MPKLTGDHVWSYLKFRRRAQDWATVGVAAVAQRSNGGVGGAAIALVNMGATPLRARIAEAAWAAGEPTRDAGGRGDGAAERHERQRRLPAPPGTRPRPAGGRGG